MVLGCTSGYGWRSIGVMVNDGMELVGLSVAVVLIMLMDMVVFVIKG